MFRQHFSMLVYYLIVLSVIVYVLRQNCRAAGWRWDTKEIFRQHFSMLVYVIRY
jgi:hypothetical protein